MRTFSSLSLRGRCSALRKRHVTTAIGRSGMSRTVRCCWTRWPRGYRSDEKFRLCPVGAPAGSNAREARPSATGQGWDLDSMECIGMRKVETDCDCCDLHVHRGANGEASRYRYNGQEYVGRAALSKAVGRPVDQIDRRIELNVCLKLRSEEHTSELQSRENLVCRLLLEKKNKSRRTTRMPPRQTLSATAALTTCLYMALLRRSDSAQLDASVRTERLIRLDCKSYAVDTQ